MLIDHPELIDNEDIINDFKSFYLECPNIYHWYSTDCKKCIYAELCKIQCHKDYPEIYKHER